MQNPQRQPQQKQEQEQPSYRTFDAPKRNNITTDPERGASPDEVEQKRKSFTMTVGRHGLGVILLLFVVVLWTSSNFLASDIFADATFSKPFFVTYFNSCCTTLLLLPFAWKGIHRLWRSGRLAQIKSASGLLEELDSVNGLGPVRSSSNRVMEAGRLTSPSSSSSSSSSSGVNYKRSLHSSGTSPQRDVSDIPKRKLSPDSAPQNLEVTEGETLSKGFSMSSSENEKLGIKQTARLAFEFCILWFTANYFAFSCLQHTTVGSATILTSTSGIWTLIIGVFSRVETFATRKFLSVVVSLIGVVLISRVDMSHGSRPNDDGNTFPQKSAAEMAVGDAMAGLSAAIYGVYVIVMKRKAGDESRMNMILFFGLVGLWSMALGWPAFFILHWAGIEKFALPAASRVWSIILFNALVSAVSDVAWAYSMLLTTPLIVTVGISLTIPLSLLGEIFINGLYAPFSYWFGAALVFLSFVLVNQEN